MLLVLYFVLFVTISVKCERWRGSVSAGLLDTSCQFLAFRRRAVEKVISVRKVCFLLRFDSEGPERLYGGVTAFGRDGNAWA